MRLPRQTGGFKIEFISQSGQIVIALRNRSGTKRIGFNDISASRQVLTMDIQNDVRPDQRQEFVVALQIFAMIGKPGPAEVVL